MPAFVTAVRVAVAATTLGLGSARARIGVPETIAAVKTYVFMACIVVALCDHDLYGYKPCIVLARARTVVPTPISAVMAYVVIVHIGLALYSYGLHSHGPI